MYSSDYDDESGDEGIETSVEELEENGEDEDDNEYDDIAISKEESELSTNVDVGDDSDSDAESEEDWSQELNEELYFESPLDDIDVYILFRQVLESTSHENNVFYQMLLNGISVEEQNIIKNVFQKAEENQLKKVKST